MTADAARRDSLASLVSDMGPRVRDLVRWCRVVRALGTADHLDISGLFLVGDTMADLAGEIEADWVKCFELSRLEQRGQP